MDAKASPFFSLRSVTRLLIVALIALSGTAALAAPPVKIGLIHPTTGRYAEQGYHQAQGALLAIEEINAKGGILGRQVELITNNSAADPARAVRQVRRQAKKGASMIMGGATSSVAIAAGKEAARHDTIFMGTLTYANETTGTEAHRHMFRETYNGWMTAKALSKYLNREFPGKKMFYVTADYNWGHSTEAGLRAMTRTTDDRVHPRAYVPFPKPKRTAMKAALDQAAASDAEVLVIIQFAQDMATALNIATQMGLKDRMQVVVTNLTQGMAKMAGAGAMEGVIGAVPWCWQVPYEFDYPRGQQFVESYLEHYNSYPTSPAASSYSAVYQFKDAAERAKSLDTSKLITALEGHSYTDLKDRQTWRKFDHQNVQSVYVVKGKDRNLVMENVHRFDYFDIVLSIPGEEAVRSHKEWSASRKRANLSLALE